MDTPEVVSAITRESVDRVAWLEPSLPHKPDAISGAVLAHRVESSLLIGFTE